jgi:hypothetical protein
MYTIDHILLINQINCALRMLYSNKTKGIILHIFFRVAFKLRLNVNHNFCLWLYKINVYFCLCILKQTVFLA